MIRELANGASGADSLALQLEKLASVALPAGAEAIPGSIGAHQTVETEGLATKESKLSSLALDASSGAVIELEGAELTLDTTRPVGDASARLVGAKRTGEAEVLRGSARGRLVGPNTTGKAAGRVHDAEPGLVLSGTALGAHAGNDCTQPSLVGASPAL